jgi:adenylate cyclase class IV
MATNIEWKAWARHPEQQRKLAKDLAGRPPELLVQIDTFFHVPRGRLKLRQLAPDRGELIFYERRDQAGPKPSHYSIVPTGEPAALRATLAQALSMRGEVHKRRWLFLVGQSRIHLDEVEGLGTFLDVEVVLAPGQEFASGERIAADLRRALDVRDEDLVDRAYIDLLTEQSSLGGNCCG